MAGTTTTIADVIDYLLTLIPTLGIDGLTVEDGYIGPNTPPLFVVVGSLAEPASDGEQQWGATGYARDEDYSVSILIGAASGGNVQKTSRDLAVAVLKTIDTAIVADPTLGGLINKSANLDRISVTQTNRETASSGRQCSIAAYLHCRNRLQRNP